MTCITFCLFLSQLKIPETRLIYDKNKQIRTNWSNIPRVPKSPKIWAGTSRNKQQQQQQCWTKGIFKSLNTSTKQTVFAFQNKTTERRLRKIKYSFRFLVVNFRDTKRTIKQIRNKGGLILLLLLYLAHLTGETETGTTSPKMLQTVCLDEECEATVRV